MSVSCLRIFLAIFSVYLYCPLFIQCPSVRPSIFVFPFSSSPGLYTGQAIAGRSPSFSSTVTRYDRPPICLSPFPARATFYIFQPVFTFEIKRGTNSRHRALMATTYSSS